MNIFRTHPYRTRTNGMVVEGEVEAGGEGDSDYDLAIANVRAVRDRAGLNTDDKLLLDRAIVTFCQVQYEIINKAHTQDAFTEKVEAIHARMSVVVRQIYAFPYREQGLTVLADFIEIITMYDSLDLSYATRVLADLCNYIGDYNGLLPDDFSFGVKNHSGPEFHALIDRFLARANFMFVHKYKLPPFSC